MNGYIDRLTRNAVRRGLKDGLRGDGTWLALGAIAWLVRFLRKKNAPAVVVERLRVGEAILVTNIGPQKGRKARRARKRARRARKRARRAASAEAPPAEATAASA
jgi:hypothetical protein